jgi:hypothetical protein
MSAQEPDVRRDHHDGGDGPPGRWWRESEVGRIEWLVLAAAVPGPHLSRDLDSKTHERRIPILR